MSFKKILFLQHFIVLKEKEISAVREERVKRSMNFNGTCCQTDYDYCPNSNFVRI